MRNVNPVESGPTLFFIGRNKRRVLSIESETTTNAARAAATKARDRFTRMRAFAPAALLMCDTPMIATLWRAAISLSGASSPRISEFLCESVAPK
jgi:hypothetical protein